MTDVFNYASTVNTEGEIASSDYAFINIGSSGRSALVQNLSVNYGQAIEEVTQVGDPQVYWMRGRPQGSVSISSLVGTGGFFSGWTGECGLIGKMSVKVLGGRCGFKGGGGLSFTGGVVERYTADLSVGRQTITQGAQIRVASMSASSA